MSCCKGIVSWQMFEGNESNYRPEVIDWLARGGTGTESLIDAYNQLAIDLDPIRNARPEKRLRLNMFADSSFSNIFVPFLVDYGVSADSNLNFVSADWSLTTGLQGDGISKSIKTGFNPTLYGIAADNFTLGVWNYTPGSVSAADIGCYYGGVWNMVVPNLSGNTWWPIGSSINVLNTVVSELGLQLATRNGDNNNRKYEDTTNTYTTVVTDLAQADGDTYIFKSDIVPSVGGYSTRRLGGYVIGDGLSASQVTTLYNALVTFNTAIGR